MAAETVRIGTNISPQKLRRPSSTTSSPSGSRMLRLASCGSGGAAGGCQGCLCGGFSGHTIACYAI
eukprot:1270057-Prymnesium_polylepis.1